MRTEIATNKQYGRSLATDPNTQVGGFQPGNYDNITGVEVYRFRTTTNPVVNVSVQTDGITTFYVDFYGANRVQRAIEWACKEYPNVKVGVNV